MPQTLKRFFALLILGLVGLPFAQACAQDTQPKQPMRPFVERLEEGAPFPQDYSLTTLNGDVINPQDFDTPIVIVHYWASWCPPCVTEFPHLLSTLQELGPDKVTLIAISVDYTQDALERYIAKLDTGNLPVYWVHDATMEHSFRRFALRGTPETYILAGTPRVIVKKMNDQYPWGTKEAWTNFIEWLQ